MWEYFFEPVMGMSYADLEARRDAVGWTVHQFTFNEILAHHLHDPDRVATFWSYDTPDDPADWLARKRAYGRQMVADYVRVKPELQAKARAFFAERLQGSYAVGVHIRGTDHAYADPIPPETYMAAIRSHVRQIGTDDYKVFLATDQQQFVEQFQSDFGSRLVVSDCLRSTTSIAPFNLNVARSPYVLGEEVLLDVLTLAQCQYLFKGASAVGEYAMWFAPQLTCTDFALKSRFRPRAVDLMVPAFTTLNVARQRGWRRWISTAWIRMTWMRRLVLAGSRLRRWGVRVFTTRP